MSGKNDDVASRDISQFLDEDGSLVAQILDDVGVMHDLMPHINRRAELRKRALDDFDCAVDAGAKAARLRQQNFLIQKTTKKQQQQGAAFAPIVSRLQPL